MRKLGLVRKVIRGRERWFYRTTWREGGKRRERYIEILAQPGSEAFEREYWSIRSGQSAKVKARPTRTTYRALIADFRASARYRRLKPGTRKSYDRVLEALLVKNADKDFTETTRAGLRAIHQQLADTPRKADWYVQIISILANHAIEEMEWRMENPAKGVTLYGTTREWEPWPQGLQDAYLRVCADPDSGLSERTRQIALDAFMLGVGTGQRPGDLCAMEWGHYDGEYIAVRQEKTEERLVVFCTARLRAHLDALPKRGRFIMAKNLSQPVGYHAVEKAFRAVREKIGRAADGYVMHGWRYTAAVELAEAGASDADIQAVTGHKTLEMVQKYRRRARQKQLSRRAQERRDPAKQNGNET
jgi:integrase